MKTDENTELARRLRGVHLFREMPEKGLRRVLQQGKIITHPAGSVLVAEGETGLAFHLVLSGEAEVLVHGEVHRVLGPGDHFGEISLIDGQARSATVRARTDVEHWALMRWNFTAILEEHPEMARSMLVGLCAHLREAEARVPAHASDQ